MRQFFPPERMNTAQWDGRTVPASDKDNANIGMNFRLRVHLLF
jgi:hypothetical protein